MNSGTEFEIVNIPEEYKGQNCAAFNIASEEYLLENCSANFIYFWRNRSAVIVGRHQNTLSEVDLEYCEKEGIEVVRRMSGGGAVYHDMGNICYTVIAPYDKDKNTYSEFCAPVIEYLNTLGVKAEFSGRNDISVGGLKISGNAQHVKGDRVLHHGTILFDTDLTVLEKALIPSPLKLKSKGIKSVRARVTNIKGLCREELTSEEFLVGLKEYFAKKYKVKCVTSEEIKKIEEIALNKYATYEWNVGRSPKSEFKRAYKFPYGIVELNFDLVEGVIRNAEFHGDFFAIKNVEILSQKLDGVKPVKEEIKKALNGLDEVVKGAEIEEFIDKLFFFE